MEIVTYIIAAVLGFFGVMFVVGAQGQIIRVIVGVILMAGAGVMIYLTRVRPKHEETTVVQKIDLSGDVKLEEMTCRNCGGTLDDENLSVRAGAIFVECPYCGASYQIEEAPKW
jgi:Zn finger protein HypA/HybF involved in hydrogenase expression